MAGLAEPDVYDRVNSLTGQAQTPAPTCKSELDHTYIDRNGESQVVLSKRLKFLAQQVGGCQTEAVLALVQRIMFEFLQHQRR